MPDNVFQFPGATEVESTAPTAPALYQVKATLNYVEPVVWRRLLIDADADMCALGFAVISCFEWSGEARFYLHKENVYFDDPDLFAKPQVPRLKGEKHVNSEGFAISDVLNLGDSCSLVYDLEEDFWEVTVELEKVVADSSFVPLIPICIDGANASPLECVGGPLGYADFLDCVNDPSSIDYENAREWAMIPYDLDYDPTAFTVAGPNLFFASDSLEELGDDLSDKSKEELVEMCKTLRAEMVAMFATAFVHDSGIGGHAGYSDFF